MKERNVERSEDLRLQLMAAVIQVCQQKLFFVEFVHITGCLSFSIDNAEKLDLVFSEVVGASPAGLSDVRLSPPLTKPGESKKQRRGGKRKCGIDTMAVVEAQPNAKEMNDLPDEDKNQLAELEKIEELLETVPTKVGSAPCSDNVEPGIELMSLPESVFMKPASRVFEDLSSSTTLLSNVIDDMVTKSSSHDDSKKRYSCNICDFVTDHIGQYRSHLTRHKGVTPKSCSVCDKSFVSSADLKRHTTQVHPRLLVKCPQCPEQFSTSVRVKKHLKAAHGVDTNMVSCQLCSQRFVTLELLQEHIRARHEKLCQICDAKFTDQHQLVAHRSKEHPDAELKCLRCGRRCPTKGALRKHMFDHRDQKQYRCDQCEKCFTSGSTLYHHRRAMHSDRKPYECKICGACFNFNNSMKLHMLRHGGQRPHKCAVCEKSYLTASHLKHHVRAVHDESKPFRCATCGKTFPYENSLRLHKMLHTGDRPFTCSFCGKSFVSRSALRAHEESHAKGAAYACDVCHRSYKSASLLRAHRRRHTSDGERFICDVCGQRFMYRSNLEAHVSVHSEARSHECTKCGKRFKTYAALYSHHRLHLPSSPFVCAKCEKSFKTKERLRAHESRHLGQKPFVCRLCNNAFPDKGGLTKHAKSVHAIRPRYACPVCNKTCNRADNLRVHMKVHGNPELLKLSLQDLSITESSDPPSRTENSFLRAASSILASMGGAPVRELGSSDAVLTPSDHRTECLHNLTNNVTDLLANSGDDTYGQNMLGLFTCAVTGENQYSDRFLRASQAINSDVLGLGERNFPTVATYELSLGFENPLDRNEDK